LAFRIPPLPAGNTDPASPGRVGQYAADPSVIAAVRNASVESGTRFDALLATAAMESGLQPNAKAAGSSAAGLYQFIDQSWLDAVKSHGATHGLSAEAAAVVNRGGQLTVEDPGLRKHIMGLRNDPYVASLMAADSLRAIGDRLTPVLGRAPDAAETYLGHFLGTGGASQVLSALKTSPGRAAADILPQAAAANSSMFYGAGGTKLTVEQFVDKVRGRLNRVYAELGQPAPSGSLDFASLAPRRAVSAAVVGGADWGVGSGGTRVRSDPERMMLSSLAEVFKRMDRHVAQANSAHAHRQGALPKVLLSAMGTTQGT
jgi:hypothetical protein